MADTVDVIMDLWCQEAPEIADQLWPVAIVGRVQRLARILDRALKDLYAEHGLEVWEFDVLTTLRRSGPPYELTPGALLEAAMITSGTVTNRIDRMEAKGLVERVRDPHDRRSVRVRLTAHGVEIVDRVFRLHLANEARLLPDYEPAEYQRFTDELRRLLEHFGDRLDRARATGTPAETA
ncbi:winged helix-turn-helix transcriptional regulator [Nocardia cyriacigeorgica]|uniref:MarR family winged helix-turn-helix transcriptional regulator n=1 Tax=Nocardia cyriacigeorgica TaxID=135487 RepID=UPI0013B7A381|nr:MarR family winged helix-turn-helix transcriptional regulator [Nocardia cyriacigeorgica]NEW51466.1 winged helix-turn-helix transcriptional regulator [Nocardia cyriacigeorgica]